MKLIDILKVISKSETVEVINESTDDINVSNSDYFIHEYKIIDLNKSVKSLAVTKFHDSYIIKIII